MALTDYASIRTEVNNYTLRSYTTGQVDTFLGLFEAKANRKLAQDFRRRSSSTVNTDASGVGTVPTGFVGLTSITRDVLGSLPLTQVSQAALVTSNPYEIGADAKFFALLSATQFQVSPVTDDDFIVVVSGNVPALTALNTTNWLLTYAPDTYFWGVMAEAAYFEQDEARGAGYEAKSISILDELVAQGNVAEYGAAEVTFGFEAP